MYKYGIVMLAIVFAACNRQETAGPADGHAHGEEAAVQSTLFSDANEFFIEYPPLEPSEEAGFLVHVTHLADYSPATSGTLTVQLGDTRATAGAPEQPGIYHVQLTAPAPGHYRLVYVYTEGNVADSVVAEAEVHAHEAAAESGEHMPGEEDEAAGEEAGHAHGGSSGEITFLKEQAWKSNFMVKPVDLHPFASVTRAGGQILAVPGEKKHLAAISDGILLFRERNLVQGSDVVKGQALFTIAPASIGENNFALRYRELKNALEKSRSEYSRHLTLFRQEVIPEKELVASKTTYVSDSLKFASLSSMAGVNGLTIVSPISGTIHALNFAEGEYVHQGDQVVTISSNQQLLLRADVPMQHYAQVGDIVTAHFRTAYSNRVYSVDSLGGTLLARGSSVAENNQFLPVYFEVANDGTLLEGAFAEFYLESATRTDRVTIPVTALMEEQGAYYVFVQVSGESYTRRAVVTGQSNGVSVEVLQGLQPGERIVTEGVMLVKAASMVTSVPTHMHNH